MIRATKIAMLAGMIATLAGCSNESGDEAGASPLGILARTATQVVAERRATPEQPATPTPARTAEQAAAEALRVNPAPLIRAGFESLGQTQIMAMTGQNGAMRTYMTSSQQAVILRGGMLSGTRGLGNDLSVTEAQTEALIRTGRSGSGQRVLRIYSGDGLERPLQFTCQVGPGPAPGVTIETCNGHGARFQNNYIVQNGQIMVSRQWAGPGLGYITIETLRP
ncbi:MAG: YjbF family lipoprotein [Paracoccus sp. (in: a-proteobacteria)]|uniref:YjbF family lipoprotein n=1 Tax=Paracoccus sp. TaxID=267 RepID=UPI0026DF90F9|nr:YjbF family lipoprotein [Paracoccus sp. (in: a-proteobacteria)]MDO5630934.1 YjbF family lipoprotein [Paracoccus sp. (in: a-proteobacteria)]